MNSTVWLKYWPSFYPFSELWAGASKLYIMFNCIARAFKWVMFKTCFQCTYCSFEILFLLTTTVTAPSLRGSSQTALITFQSVITEQRILFCVYRCSHFDAALMSMSLLWLHVIYAVSVFKSLFFLPCACWQVVCCQVKIKFVLVLCFLLFSCSQTSQNPACHIVRALWVRFLMYKHCTCSLLCMQRLILRDRKCTWSTLIAYYESSLKFC